MNSTEVVVEGTYIRESGAAVLVEQDNNQIWIPRGSISYLRKGPAEQDGTRSILCHLPAWLARKKGLDYKEGRE